MRFANVAGRAHILDRDGYVDVAAASGGLLPADPQECVQRWSDVIEWARSRPRQEREVIAADVEELQAPVPRPRQILAVGLNYRAHSDETGLGGSDEIPLTFTKFVTSITGPAGTLDLPSGSVDWEVEMVVVIGSECRRVTEADALDHVAGVTVGQDFSDRSVQMQGSPPQFSLGKSFPGFSPIGPHLVTLDELADSGIGDLHLTCAVNGEIVQDGRTSQLIHSVPRLIALYSNVVTLLPGDLIFTGTPAGVGMGRTPPRYLNDGDEVVTEIAGVGRMVQRCRRLPAGAEC